MGRSKERTKIEKKTMGKTNLWEGKTKRWEDYREENHIEKRRKRNVKVCEKGKKMEKVTV